MIGYKEFRAQIATWTVRMDAEVLTNGDKNNDGKKGNDPDEKSPTNDGERPGRHRVTARR